MKKKGFTLIELMVVITIILVMLGFLIPKLYGYQQKAKQTKAINTAKQIQTAAMASYSDYNQEFDATDVKSSIGKLTGVDITDPKMIVADAGTIHQNINVTFESDSVVYVVGVDAQSSNFTVTDDASKTIIFPKNQQ